LSDTLEASLNPTGTAIVLVTAFLVSLFLSTTFSFAWAIAFLKPRFSFISAISERWTARKERREEKAAAEVVEPPKKEKPVRKQTIVTDKPSSPTGRGQESEAVVLGEGPAPIRKLKIPKSAPLTNPE